jgi:hypothetical protein
MASRIFSSAVVAGCLIAVGPISVVADGITVRLQAIAKACDPDIQTFCAGLTPGGGRVMRCLGANYMSTSPACRGSMASAMNDICGQDLARLCPGATLGSGEAESCLQTHVAQLKGSCKVAADRLAVK